VTSVMLNGKRFIFCSKHPGQLWGPPSLIFSRYQGCFCW
jgi:hypothetical protein